MQSSSMSAIVKLQDNLLMLAMCKWAYDVKVHSDMKVRSEP